MSEPPVTTDLTEWANIADVYSTLGKLGPKVKEAADNGRFEAEAHLSAARAEAFTRLEHVYGVGGVPSPEAESPALEVVRWAVARIAAANILDILRASLPDVSELPERLRRTAWASLDGALPGFPPGGGPNTPGTTNTPWASSGGVSQFPDPYLIHPGDDPRIRGGYLLPVEVTWTL